MKIEYLKDGHGFTAMADFRARYTPRGFEVVRYFPQNQNEACESDKSALGSDDVSLEGVLRDEGLLQTVKYRTNRDVLRWTVMPVPHRYLLWHRTYLAINSTSLDLIPGILDTWVMHLGCIIHLYPHVASRCLPSR